MVVDIAIVFVRAVTDKDEVVDDDPGAMDEGE
jgi:hypothetical protein